MILKLAFRNIVGYGWRSLINMIIIAIVMIGMIWMQAMMHSWLSLAVTDSMEWEVASGQYHHKDFDRYDVFSWDSSHAPIPTELQAKVASGKAAPILLSQAVIYPQGRMTPVAVKGINAEQQLLKLPTHVLDSSEDHYIPAMIGGVMARNTRLQEGDIVTMRIKDIHGSFNALDLKIVHVMKTPVPTTDAGQIWIDLPVLQDVMDMPGSATLVVVDSDLMDKSFAEWTFLDTDTLLADFYKVMETEQGSQVILYALLLFLAMIAVFDTQILALFKRRKEIGTLSALGMTKNQIILLFTTEGVLYSVFSVFFTAVLGFPLFWYYAVYGYKMPSGFEDFGIAGLSDSLRFTYPLPLVLRIIFFVIVLTAITSWIPAARISRMKTTDALRGKVN